MLKKVLPISNAMQRLYKMRHLLFDIYGRVRKKRKGIKQHNWPNRKSNGLLLRRSENFIVLQRKRDLQRKRQNNFDLQKKRQGKFTLAMKEKFKHGMMK